MQQNINAIFAMNLINEDCNVKIFFGCFVLCLGVSLSASAISEPWHHNHDIHRFHERNVTAWRGGYWYNGVRGGRRGSYWVIGGVYYYYPTAVHPYPNPYVPGVIYSESHSPSVVIAPVTVVPPATVVTTSQAQNPPSVWYYCEASASYYPYTPECPSGWKAVPATLSPTPQN
jgi:hypothetical protein